MLARAAFMGLVGHGAVGGGCLLLYRVEPGCDKDLEDRALGAATHLVPENPQ